jgi:valyl-tRNA synthetase
MVPSIHQSEWPVPDERWIDEEANNTGELLLEIARLVRRYKSEHNLPLGTTLTGVKLAVGNTNLVSNLKAAIPDLRSITRVIDFEIDVKIKKSTVVTTSHLDIDLEIIP